MPKIKNVMTIFLLSYLSDLDAVMFVGRLEDASETDLPVVIEHKTLSLAPQQTANVHSFFRPGSFSGCRCRCG